MKTLLILFTMLVFTLPAIAQKDLSLTLPDGNQLQTWNDETEYSKTYFVDQVHPKANDANQGIEDQPFLTIQKAADVLQPGEKVIVKSGIYREFVRPARGGKSPGSMICYEVANGAKVIVKGTQKVDTEWTRSIAPNGQEFSFKLSQTKLDQNMFDDDNPFKTQNANKAEMDVMPWAVDWTGHVPYTLPRGLVFQNGKRMLQMVAYVDLIKLPGSYWVAPDGETIHVHPFKGADIASSNFEVTTHQQIFK